MKNVLGCYIEITKNEVTQMFIIVLTYLDGSMKSLPTPFFTEREANGWFDDNVDYNPNVVGYHVTPRQ